MASTHYRLEQSWISTMLLHVTLHVTLKFLYFTIVLDMQLHVTPIYLKGTRFFLKVGVTCCNL
jgi:hypothetical protein